MRAEEFKQLILGEIREKPNRPRMVDLRNLLRRIYRWQLAIEGTILGLVLVTIGIARLLTLSASERTVAALAIISLAIAGGLAFILAPLVYAVVLAHGIRIGVLAEAEVVAGKDEGSTETELLVPHPRGSFRKEFNPKQVWVAEGRAAVGAKILTLVHPEKQRVLIEVGPLAPGDLF